jgi:hypothetical protein
MVHIVLGYVVAALAAATFIPKDHDSGKVLVYYPLIPSLTDKTLRNHRLNLLKK